MSFHFSEGCAYVALNYLIIIGNGRDFEITIP